MAFLVLGMLIFLGVHSIRIVADDWRSAQIARLGKGTWKALFALASLIGLALIVWGYGDARAVPVQLYSPPVWTRHLAALLTVPAFVLVAAAYVPRNHMRAGLGHPMVLGVKLWAFAHLLANGTLADVILFGGFLIWAIVDFAASRRRDRRLGTTYAPGTWGGDAITVVAGLVVWFVFATQLHGMLFGVRPFG